MNAITKTAAVGGLVGALALASMTASEARVRPWAAAGIGFAAGALIGAAAANAHSRAQYGYYYGPHYAYDPYYAPAPVYAAPVYATPVYAAPVYAAPAYEAYAYSPGYVAAPNDAWRYSPAYHGYDTNYIGPARERQLSGSDY
jgi:hypothetical protein